MHRARVSPPSDPAAPTTGRRQLLKVGQRRRIYQAAIELFVKKGFDDVTVDEITRRADVAKGTFFNYFPTKTDVLADYFQALIDDLLSAGERLRGVRARGLFTRFFQTAAARCRRDGRLFEILVRQAFVQSTLIKMDQSTAPRVLALYTRFLKIGIQSDELRDDFSLELAAHAIGDLWTGTLIEWAYEGYSPALVKKMTAKLDLFFDGLHNHSA